MANLREFSKAMKTRAKNLGDNVPDLVRKTALAIDVAVTQATPVDTGRARANWQIGLGSAPTGVVSVSSGTRPRVKGMNKKERKKSIRSWRSARDAAAGVAAQEALKNAQSVLAAYKGGAIYIRNNLPYIGALNRGHSRQAPAGFVQRAAFAARAAVEQSVSGLTSRKVSHGERND